MAQEPNSANLFLRLWCANTVSWTLQVYWSTQETMEIVVSEHVAAQSLEHICTIWHLLVWHIASFPSTLARWHQHAVPH